MKKILFAFTLLLTTAAYAQTDSIRSHPNDTIETGPYAYFDTAEYEGKMFYKPRRNPIYYFGNPFCEHFAEGRLIIGPEGIGLGGVYSYIPEVWGFNVSTTLLNSSFYWVSGGGAYRLSKPWTYFDWHLYSNIGLNYDNHSKPVIYPTLEAGVRLASPDGSGKFCMTSASVGVLTDFHSVYVTMGFGISITAVVAMLLLLGNF